MSAGVVSIDDAAHPLAWRGRPQWRILQVGWDGGAAFLHARRAWHEDPRRPALLHFVALPASTAQASRLLGVDGVPPAFLEELAALWQGLTPGFHRFSFDQGRVLLTLCVGDLEASLREHAFRADEVLLADTAAWTPASAKAVTRLCRRGATLRATEPAPGAAQDLAGCGWQAVAAESGLVAHYEPVWTVKGLEQADVSLQPSRATVIGAGLAGAAVAASLARRGWSVLVLDAGAAPASGASQLPVGLLAPHQTPDDNVLSRLSRAGVRITLQEAQSRLARGLEWEATGVLEWRGDDRRAPPEVEGLSPWTRPASEAQKRLAGWPPGQAAWWHEYAAWIEPAALVRSWLREPGVRFEGGWRVGQVQRDGAQWRVEDASGERTATSALVVVAAALGSAALLPSGLSLQPVRGQVTWGARPQDAKGWPPFPVNGNGHFLPDVPLLESGAWVTGSTYGRGDADARARAEDDALNLERSRTLVPAAAMGSGAHRSWSGVRCASTDRRPLVGELAPGLWTSTAMGSRGLTFAALCAELLAAQLHGEPLPLPLRLARALDAARQLR
jgi:tRNA 5-methylaminomethyl-2-thiouridine biosynthesis bifunctional protein